MIGTFLEELDDEHVSLRAKLLGQDPLPMPRIPTLMIRAASLLDHNRALVEASLGAHGICLIQLDEPFSSEKFIRFGNTLGSLVAELDSTVQPYVEERVILHLRTSLGPTERVDRQPFASNFLTLHTESSGHNIVRQPIYVVLMCLQPGIENKAPQTVVVPMDSVINRLSRETIDILAQTRYDNARGSPSIMRRENDRWVICFRDFHRQSLSWIYDGNGSVSRVNDAIRELLAAMYNPQDAVGLSWKRGLLGIIDNRKYLHGRSEGAYALGQPQRHLVRLRIRPHVGNLDEVESSVPQSQLHPDIRLFANPLRTTIIPKLETGAVKHSWNDSHQAAFHDEAFIDERALDVFARAKNPDNPFELRDLWLGRVESDLGVNGLRPQLAELWRSAKVLRSISKEEVLNSRSTVRMVKELFNTYFRDDLYGALRSDNNIILSSGSVDEEVYGLPTALKETIRFALSRDWYGYSDSRGREAARVAVAEYESARLPSANYSAENVVLTIGATHAISSLADFILPGKYYMDEPALCGIPNYPPLVEAVAKRHPVRLIPTTSDHGSTSLVALRHALTPRTPMVLLQTGVNPTGSLINEDELERFIEATHPSTIVLLDECHEWLGAPREFCCARAGRNIIRISSLSKEWSAPGLKVGWFLADPSFVADYYEYASTGYGGPPSLFYTLIEFLARFESWRNEGLIQIGRTQVHEFEGSYGLTSSALNSAYQSYIQERDGREQALKILRSLTVSALHQAGGLVLPPRCSINLLTRLPGYDDSYVCFRDVLRQAGVSVYPGVLCYCLGGGYIRITFARKWSDLSKGLNRLGRHCRFNGEDSKLRGLQANNLPVNQREW